MAHVTKTFEDFNNNSNVLEGKTLNDLISQNIITIKDNCEYGLFASIEDAIDDAGTSPLRAIETKNMLSLYEAGNSRVVLESINDTHSLIAIVYTNDQSASLGDYSILYQHRDSINFIDLRSGKKMYLDVIFSEPHQVILDGATLKQDSESATYTSDTDNIYIEVTSY